jgi:hypothetical protein
MEIGEDPMNMNAEEGMDKNRILLVHVPYWDPMIPPMGIASLKRYLEKQGYQVRIADLNVREVFKEIYNTYFDLLRRYIPEQRQGNFYNIGHDVLQNHMMAFINQEQKGKEDYLRCVGILVKKSFYAEFDPGLAEELDRCMHQLFEEMLACVNRLIEEEKPGVFGLTAYKGTLPSCIYLFGKVKETWPQIRTIMGGGAMADSHVMGSPNFEKLLEITRDCLDHIFIGQGEKLFQGWLKGDLPEEKRVYTKADVGGSVLDFPSLEVPDFSDLEMEQYPYLAATASTGCLYQCSFCNSMSFWGKHRQKETSQIVREMRGLHGQHRKQLFFMTDSLLNLIITDLAQAMMESGVSLYYDAYFKVDETSGNIDNTILWRKGGLYRVRLGTESGSQRILDAMNKEITVEMIRKTLSAMAYAGIKTTTYWVIGHPGETEEDFKKTLEILEELQADIFQAECNPFVYHYSGQSSSDQWARHRIPLYPEEMDDILVFKSWTLDMEPKREEAYERMYRFTDHCNKLGIPNPYTLDEHFRADERWKKLHRNAVPPLIEFRNTKKYMDECKSIRKLNYTKNPRKDFQGFGF